MDHHDYIAPVGCRRRSNRFKGRKALSYAVVCAILLSTLLPGCSSLWKAQERVVYKHDTLAVHHRDSIHLRDSIYIREWVKGDTVYVDRFRDRYLYRDRWRDSIRVVRDSVAVETIKKVEVEKPLSWWQKARIGSFWWLLGSLAAALAWIFRKPLMRMFKIIV